MWSPLSLLLSVAVLVSSCAATPTPPSKAKIIDQTELSIVRLEHSIDEEHSYVCTGFMVDHYRILTALHCVGEGMLANGIPVEVIKTSDSFALLQSPINFGPILKIRKTPVHSGDEGIGIGYGLGFLNVFTRFVTVPVYQGTELILDGLFINGMSGGPVVDRDGLVIGLIQSGYMGTLAITCGQDEIRTFIQ